MFAYRLGLSVNVANGAPSGSIRYTPAVPQGQFGTHLTYHTLVVIP